MVTGIVHKPSLTVIHFTAWNKLQHEHHSNVKQPHTSKQLHCQIEQFQNVCSKERMHTETHSLISANKGLKENQMCVITCKIT